MRIFDGRTPGMVNLDTVYRHELTRRHRSLTVLCPHPYVTACTRPMLDVFLTVSKILVIEDSKMMSRYLRERLEEAGYEVEEWLPLSAMEVPEHIIASATDLILTDYQMPGCNGVTLARMAQRANPKIPVIVLTAFRDQEMESNLLRLGVRQVLSKPIGARDLTQAIEDALSAHATES